MRPNLKMSDLKEGGVYYSRSMSPALKRQYRRVVKILDGQVFYCSGGEEIHSCSIKTFLYTCTLRKPSDN